VITFYATTPHCYTFSRFIEIWAPELAESTRIVGYSEIDLAAAPAPGLHVLTDFERLIGPERAFVRRLHRRLSDHTGIKVLGNPSTWLDRHALLARLHEEGINDFRAYRVDELGPHVRFPVFLRWANAHDGSLGGPIRNRKALDRQIARIARDRPRRWRWIRDQLLVVEKVGVRSEDGYFRKYSIARYGDQYVPRHVEIGRHWVTKFPEIVTPETVVEEDAFLAEPLDAELIERVFEIAGIEFGRIDWGYAGGRPQIWEINTNPMLAAGETCHELRVPSQRRLAAITRAALESQVPAAGVAPSSSVVPLPERWALQAINRGSRYWDARRR
jgi:uncharacterized protein (UPF0216 family)